VGQSTQGQREVQRVLLVSILPVNEGRTDQLGLVEVAAEFGQVEPRVDPKRGYQFG